MLLLYSPHIYILKHFLGHDSRDTSHLQFEAFQDNLVTYLIIANQYGALQLSYNDWSYKADVYLYSYETFSDSVHI